MFSQLPERERILIQIENEPNDTVRIKLIIRYVMVWSQYLDDKKWFDEIYKLSIKNNFRQGLIYYRYYEGIQLSDKGNYEDAIAKVKSCIDGLDSIGIIQPYAYPLYFIRYIYWQAGKKLEMFQYYSAKIVYYRKYGPIENLADCYHALGRYYLSLADYDVGGALRSSI